MAKKKLYDTLGVSEEATQNEIQKAYRKLALKWHPDKNKAPEAEDKFIEIQKAYAILDDVEERGKYDRGEIDDNRQQVKPSQRPISPTPTAPHAIFKKAGKDTGIKYELLVPIEDIIKKFDAFKDEKLVEKNSQGDLKYSNSSFKHEKIDGPPTTHIFTFPDKASMDEFINQLLQSKMVKRPDAPQESVQRAMKETLSDFRSAIEPATKLSQEDEQPPVIHPHS